MKKKNSKYNQEKFFKPENIGLGDPQHQEPAQE